MRIRQIQETCLLFGEGTSEEKLFQLIENSQRFKNRFPNWRMETAHASGEACKVILSKCINYISEKDFKLVLCFMDTDKLVSDFRNNSEKEKARLETLAMEHEIIIIWQETNHEEELSRATNQRITTQAGRRRRFKNNENRILGSAFIKRIFDCFPN